MVRAQANYISGTTYIGGYHIKCNGQSTGNIKANPSFGTPPYTFLWNTGETTAEIFNKPAGIYSVIMSDSNNVTHNDTFEIRQPYVLGYQSTLSDYYGFNIDAHGANTGGIQLNATGGTPPYRYTWNNGDSVSNRRDLFAGNYSFVITDANQCSTSGNITLTQPNPLQVSFSNIQNLSCFKKDDGKATLNLSGGLGDYSVVWDNGNFSLSPEDLHAGFNAVRIFEHGTAVLDTGITLSQPDEMDIQFTYSDYNGYGVSCVDCYNGTVASTVTGGTAPYTYQWEDANSSNTPNLSNLNGGEIVLNINDANGCKASNTDLLTMPISKDWSRFGNANIDTSMFIGSTDTSAVIFKTNNFETMRMVGNGNVGVGTSNPTEKLEVNGNIKAQGLKLNNLNIQYEAASSLGPEKIIWGATTPANAGSVGAPLFPSTCIDPLNIDLVNVYNGGAVYKVKSLVQNNSLCSASDPTLYVGLYGCNGVIETNQIDDNGNQAFPTSKLLINTLCGKDVVVGRTDGGNLIVNHNLGIGVQAPTEKLEVNGNGLIVGKLGIGNVSPVAALHIKDGVANSLIIENTQSFNKFQIESASGASRLINSGSVYIYLNADQDAGDNTSEFIITKNASYSGQSGGTELFKLKNDGTAYLKDLWVKAPSSAGAFPDYVFAANYQLKSLEEVKEYYTKYHHLPDLPSAKEIESNGGLSISEMLIKLTKIVEENTIYLTQQNDQIKQLQAENLKLKKSIEKLTKK